MFSVGLGAITKFLSTMITLNFILAFTVLPAIVLCISSVDDNHRKPDLIPHIDGQPGIGCAADEEWKPCGACDRACGQGPVICSGCRKGSCGCIKDYRRTYPKGPCRHYLQCADLLNPLQPLKCPPPCPYGRYCAKSGYCQKYWIWTEPLDQPDFGDRRQ